MQKYEFILKLPIKNQYKNQYMAITEKKQILDKNFTKIIMITLK